MRVRSARDPDDGGTHLATDNGAMGEKSDIVAMMLPQSVLCEE